MKEYDKIVRDKIPNIIRNSGKECEVETVSDAIALEYLYKKLIEEVNEFFESMDIEEIIDVMEVLFAIGSKRGYENYELLELMMTKRHKNGGFNDNIILKKVYNSNK